MKARLEEEAAKNKRSLNAEIIARLEGGLAVFPESDEAYLRRKVEFIEGERDMLYDTLRAYIEDLGKLHEQLGLTPPRQIRPKKPKS